MLSALTKNDCSFGHSLDVGLHIDSHRTIKLQVIWQNYPAIAKHFADNIT